MIPNLCYTPSFCKASLHDTPQNLIDQKKEERKHQRMWLRFDFPPSVLTSHPDCVSFMMQSHFGFALEMFKNNPPEGKTRHEIRLDIDGHPLIKMQKKWTRWEEINQLLEYNHTSCFITSKGDPKTVWNYISPDGIVKKSIFFYDSLYPIEKIDRQEQKILKQHAAKFWLQNKEIDPGKTKDCVFQISTNWNHDVLPVNHSAIRLIDKKGRVYSFGLALHPEETNYIKGSWFTLFASITAKVSCYDWEETYAFKVRHVTSIPITSERLQAILSFVSEENKKGIRFNFVKQNCTTFAAIILGKAGVELSVKEPLLALLNRMTENHFCTAETLHKVHAAFCLILEAIEDVTSKPIKMAVLSFGSVIQRIAEKIACIALNILALVFGAWYMSPSAVINETGFANFKRLVNHPRDLLNSKLLDYDSSYLLRAWQRQQPTNCVYRYGGRPNLYMHPNNHV
jgi:hypothetical protein